MYPAPRGDRARGALLGAFVGDALGMPYEGAPAAAVPERVEMAEARLGRGTYTDDTQMTIALAESLLELGTIEEEHLGRAFLDAYEPERGYGRGTREVLSLAAAGIPFVEAAARVFAGGGSPGNGAAMRVAPVAIRYAGNPERLLDGAERSARVTHAHALGVDGARVQAVAVAAALRAEDPVAAARAAAGTAELRRRLDLVSELLAKDFPLAPPAAAALLGTGSTAPESVAAAVYAASASEGFEAAVTYAVRCGGDTDTVAAMAGAIAGAREGNAAIPNRWLTALEDGPKGRQHVERLADRLAEAASRP